MKPTETTAVSTRTIDAAARNTLINTHKGYAKCVDAGFASRCWSHLCSSPIPRHAVFAADRGSRAMLFACGTSFHFVVTAWKNNQPSKVTIRCKQAA